MNMMKALVFEKPGKIQLKEMPVPEVTQPDDVLIKVAACGVCGTDIKILEGKHVYSENTILGHEFTGTVVGVGPKVTTLRVGDRVSVDNNIRCGVCSFCRLGLDSQCVEIAKGALGVRMNGGYAEYCVAPERVCYALPAEIDDILATQVETLSPVLNGVRTVQINPWDFVLVMGFGPIGYLFAALARNVAAQVAVTEIDPFRINLAKSMGYAVFNPHVEDVGQRFVELTGGHKADVVIEAIGTEFESAIRYITPGGKLLPVGMDSSARSTIAPNDITRGAFKILGIYLGHNTMLPAIRVLQAGRVDMRPFFTEVIPLEQGLSAFPKLGLDLQTMQHIPKSAMKIVLKM